jgi:hypothetical protein
LVAEARRRGIDCVVYAGQGADAAVRAALPVQPLFRYGLDHRFSQDLLSSAIENYVIGNQVYLEDLRRLDVGQLAPDDVLLFLAINHAQLQAIGTWAQAVPPASLPRIVIGLWHEPHHEGEAMSEDMAYALYRLAFKAFLDPSAQRVRFACLTAGQADRFSLIAGRPCLAAPMPFTSADEALTPADGDPTPSVGFFGSARKIDGFELIPGVITGLRASHPAIRCTVLIDGPPAALDAVQPTVAALEKLAAAGPGVRLLRGPLEDETSLAAFRTCGVIALPYRRRFYEFSASPAFMTAMSLAKPVVLPINTWMGQTIGAWRVGTVFEIFSSAGVAAAIRGVLDDLPAFQTRARDRALQWRRTQGVGPFVDFILQDRAATPSADRPPGP